MSLRSRTSRLVKRLALQRGMLIQRVPPRRHGDPFTDQAALLEGRPVTAILDVGAYVGETVLAYRALFPEAEIHCFEPVPASFARLSEALAGDRRAILNRLAVGDSADPLEMTVNAFAATSSRLRPASSAAAISGEHLFDLVERRSVPSTTIDEYLLSRGIDRVDILKIDIQGGELAALEGASNALEEGRIRLIYLEILVAPIYELQPSVGEVLNAAERRGYRLHGLYNFAYSGQAGLSQMDAILIK